MTEVVRPYRGISADHRRQQRRRLVLGACLDVVGEVGVAGTTVDLICKQAGLSKRYFYESFPDRETALVAVIEGVLDGTRRALEATLIESPNAPPREQMRLLVAATVASIATDPRISRLWIEANHHPALEQRRNDGYTEFAELLLRILMPTLLEDRAARASTLLVVSGTTEVLRRWLADPGTDSQEDVVDLLTDIGLAVTGAVLARSQN